MANVVAGDVLSLKKTVLACALALGAAGAAVAGPSVVVFDSLSNTDTVNLLIATDANGNAIPAVTEGVATLAAGTPRNFSGYQTYVYNEGTAAVSTTLTLEVFNAMGVSLFSVAAPVVAQAGVVNLFTIDCNCGVLTDSIQYELSLADFTGLYFTVEEFGMPAVGTDSTPGDGTISLRINAVPEPSTFALGALGLFAAFRRRKA